MRKWDAGSIRTTSAPARRASGIDRGLGRGQVFGHPARWADQPLGWAKFCGPQGAVDSGWLRDR
jgi:hypothetical protein